MTNDKQRLDQRLQATLQRLRERRSVQAQLTELPPEARAARLAALAMAELRDDPDWTALLAAAADG
jgi:hypothetical protein